MTTRNAATPAPAKIRQRNPSTGKRVRPLVLLESSSSEDEAAPEVFSIDCSPVMKRRRMNAPAISPEFHSLPRPVNVGSVDLGRMTDSDREEELPARLIDEDEERSEDSDELPGEFDDFLEDDAAPLPLDEEEEEEEDEDEDVEPLPPLFPSDDEEEPLDMDLWFNETVDQPLAVEHYSLAAPPEETLSSPPREDEQQQRVYLEERFLAPPGVDNYPQERVLEITDSEYILAQGGYILPSLFKRGFCNVLRAQMGVGKTEAAAAFLSSIPRCKTLVVVPRKSLAGALADKFQCVDYQKVHPTKYNGDTSYVICVNSLHLIKKHLGKFDVVVFDELSGTIGNVFSSLMGEFTHRITTLSQISYLLNPSKWNKAELGFPSDGYPGKTVLVMDASMNEREFRFIKKCTSPEYYRSFCYYRPQNIKPLPRVVFEPCMNNFLRDLAADILCTEKRIVVATCAKEYMGVILKLLCICSDDFLSGIRLDTGKIIRPRPKFCYFDAETSKDRIQAHIDDQELFRQYDVFVYSPVLVSGISITVDHFDKLYALSKYGTLTAPDLVQMISRVRTLNDNQIVIGCSGACVKISDDKVSLEYIKESLKNISSQTEEFRENVYQSLGISTSIFHYRFGTYKSKAALLNAIDNYFRAECPEYQRDLMADTARLYLQTRKNMFQAIQDAMKWNHREWDLILSEKSHTRGSDLGKDALCALLLTSITELGDIRSIGMEDFLVIDIDTFDDKCEKYAIFGKGNFLGELESSSSEGGTREQAPPQFRNDMIQSSFHFINSFSIRNFLMFMSPFSTWYAFITSYSSHGNNTALAEELGSMQMYADLFVAMGLIDHLVCLEGGTFSRLCLIATEFLYTLKVSTMTILRRWIPLMKWGETYRLSIAMLGVTPFTHANNQISYKNITVAKDCLVKILYRTGLVLKDNGTYIGQKILSSGKLSSGRIRRKAASTYAKEIQRYFPHDYAMNLPEGLAESRVQLPCYVHELDLDSFWRTVDISLRRGFNLHFGDSVHEILNDNAKCLGIVFENSRRNIISQIPRKTIEDFTRLYALVHPLGAEIISQPSWWVLADEEKSRESLTKLKKYYAEFSDTIHEFCYALKANRGGGGGGEEEEGEDE